MRECLDGILGSPKEKGQQVPRIVTSGSFLGGFAFCFQKGDGGQKIVSVWFAGGFGQELDDFPVFPNDHRNAHEPVLLGGFLHGPLHNFGNFLDALVSGFHGRSRCGEIFQNVKRAWH